MKKSISTYIDPNMEVEVLSVHKTKKKTLSRIMKYKQFLDLRKYHSKHWFHYSYQVGLRK